jgi:hypothetical protein
VTWSRQEADGAALHAQRYTAAGVKQGNEIRVADSGTGGAPAVTATPQGGFVVAWTGQGESGGGTVYARRYDALGRLADGGPRSSAASVQLSPSALAPLADGGFALAWTAWSAEGPSLHTRSFGPLGTLRSSGTDTVPDGADPSPPRLVGASDGTVVVLWAVRAADGESIRGQRLVLGRKPGM